MTGNSAGAGGGIHNGGMLTLGNTIIGGNPSGGDCFANNVYGVTDDGHNLIADAASSCGLRNGMKGDIEGVDPMLGPLANNGGPTPTHALCTGASVPDPACRGPSPAIDAVPLDYCLDAQGNPLETDQRGASRLDGAACDVGAYESGAVPPPACVGDCNDDGTVTIDDLLVLVRIALGDAEAACQHGVPGGATVDVALIIQAVNRASAGCGG